MPEPPDRIRSWRVVQLGRPVDALRLVDAVPDRPGPGQARVAMGAVGLNFPDLLLCAGRYQERPALPFSPGFEGAGTVVEVGPGSAVAPGQRVIVVPELPNGALQGSVTVPSSQLYPIPEDVPLATAAVLHVAYETAQVALHHRGGLRSGETVLVTGASGGVGSAAIQLGRAAGARVVAVATGPAKCSFCRDLGADEVIDLGSGQDLAEQVRDLTGGQGADLIVDVVGGDLFDRVRRCVAFEGRIVVVGFTGGTVPAVPTNHLLLRNYSIIGLFLSRYRREDPSLLQRVHRQVVDLWRDGVVAPAIYREVPFEEVPAGLGLLARREAMGRVVVTC